MWERGASRRGEINSTRGEKIEWSPTTETSNQTPERGTAVVSGEKPLRVRTCHRGKPQIGGGFWQTYEMQAGKD